MEDKVKVQEIAEEAGATSTEVMSKALDLGIKLKSVQSAVSFEEAEEITNYLMTGKSKLLKKSTPSKKNTTKKEKIKEKKSSKTSTNKDEKDKKSTQKQQAKKTTSKKNKTSIKNEKDKSLVSTNENGKQVVLKKRGLTIVKKNKSTSNNLTSTDEVNKKQSMKSMSELFGKTPELKETYVPKQKKQKKTPAKSHEHGKILDVQSGESFGESNDSILGEEVMLHDMNLIETSKFLQETSKKTQQIKIAKPSAFGNRPRGLKRNKKKKTYKKTTQEVKITEVTIPQECRVYEFAQKIGKTAGDVIGKLFMLGMMVTKNDFLGNDEIEILGEEYNIKITIKDELEDVNYEDNYKEMISNNSNFVSRAPVVTIMGHVDHGKTSLLDKIRSSRIAVDEAGGITQHISAYTINKNGYDITFIDTPGHEAFKAMRMRGAKITDIIIIVVAADDGVKPQTIESIKAAKESGVPIIVAVNKMDKETANLDMVKSSMAEHNMTPVDWGGDIEFIPISAKTGAGIEDLLETIILQAELLELKADPTALCKAIVLEASTQKGRGAVVTIIVQNGTLKIGDNIVADTTFGKVKAIINDQGKSVKELGLSCAGTVVGLANIPSTGVLLVAQNSINEAKEIATKRAQYARAKELSASTKVTLDEMAGLIAEGKIKALPVIIKADAGGSLEAIKGSLESIKNDEVKVKILSAGVGGITEADLSLANTGENTIILGFNVRPTGSVKTKAKVYGIEIKTYSIIYQLIDDIKDILSGMMSEIVTEENTGQAQVLETFVIPKIGTVAGTKVTDGKVIRGGLARVIRDGIVIYTGKIKSLKRFKDDVKEVANGFECGIIFENFNDIKIDDYIETFIEHRKLQSLD
jgi:translation initiation factor IF-2